MYFFHKNNISSFSFFPVHTFVLIRFDLIQLCYYSQHYASKFKDLTEILKYDDKRILNFFSRYYAKNLKKIFFLKRYCLKDSLEILFKNLKLFFKDLNKNL